MAFIEATSFREGRSGASRDCAATILRRIIQSIGIGIGIGIKPKASATKAAGYFLLSEATKESNQRKVPSVSDQEPASAMPTQGRSRQAIHGLLAHGPHPCGPPYGSIFDRQSGTAVSSEQ
ncbi:hypothetical protein [Lysobacter sp. 1R34A]|uniref:hypothetical protein n=1 Tax=Lysobacter sp. 1R34A TaxID=3445786 RepID=UPI003EECC8CF